MTALLDANVLIALSVIDHVHHEVAEDWFAQRDGPFATCPMTQGALVRFVVRNGAAAAEAIDVVRGLMASPSHEFWRDGLTYDQVDMRGVVGHRQVSDAYLAALARSRTGRLITLDRGLAALHPDVSELLDAHA